MKNQQIFKILFLSLFIIFISCENEINPRDEKDISSIQEEKTASLIVSSNNVSSNDIPEIMTYLNKRIGSKYLSKSSSNSTNTNSPILDFENILSVLDTLDNTNYTINFLMPNGPKNTFYNLVIGKDSLGQVTDPIVIKFELDEEQNQEFKDSGNDLSFFKGSMSLENYTNYFPSELFLSTETNCNQEFDENGDPAPCDVVNLNGNSGNNSGGQSGVSGFSGYTGGGNACIVTAAWDSCGGKNGDSAHSSQICRGDGGGAGWVVTVDCPNGSYTQQDHSRINKTQGLSNCSKCSNGPSGTVGVNATDIKPFVIEKNIISTELDPCSNQILTELKNLEQNDIAKYLQRLGGINTVYNWELKTAAPLINSENSAETDWERDSNDEALEYQYLTHIKPSYVNGATQNSIARTILHEMLHAYLISLVDDVNITQARDVLSFPTLWNALINNTYNDNPNRLQHEIIGRKFIEPLRDALKEWNQEEQPDQYYEDLAWGALENTSTFNKLFPINSSDRNRILNTNKAEDNNRTVNGVTPKSAPCN